MRICRTALWGLTIVACLLVAGLLTGCRKGKAQTIIIARIPVEIVEAKQGSITETVLATGTIQPFRRVTPATKITGRVLAVNCQEGDFVKKDAELVRFLDTDIRAQRAQAQASLEASQADLEGMKSRRAELEAVLANARIEWERAENLLAKNAISKAERDKARSLYLVAEARLNGLGAQRKQIEAQILLHKARIEETDVLLKYALIRAPYDGYVRRKIVEVGDLVTPGSPVLVVDDLSKVKVIGLVAETDIPKVRIGSDVTLKIDALPELAPAGKVTRIVWSGDPRSRAFSVEIVVPNRFSKGGRPPSCRPCS